MDVKIEADSARVATLVEEIARAKRETEELATKRKAMETKVGRGNRQ